MREGFVQKLTDDYPQLLTRVRIGCGDGWHDILEDLFENIMKLDPPQNFTLTQIKEKYGGLVIHANFLPSGVEEVITEAEVMTTRTCELCGHHGKARTKRGWISTRCESCWEEENENAHRKT